MLASLVVSAAPSAVSADEIGPDDQYCEIEVQQRDGSRCEVCEVSVTERQSGQDPCAELEARDGWSRRCSVGATHQRILYCDREANFVTVGRRGIPSGGLCSCRVGASTRDDRVACVAALLVGALAWARRRRPR